MIKKLVLALLAGLLTLGVMGCDMQRGEKESSDSDSIPIVSEEELSDSDSTSEEESVSQILTQEDLDEYRERLGETDWVALIPLIPEDYEDFVNGNYDLSPMTERMLSQNLVTKEYQKNWVESNRETFMELNKTYFKYTSEDTAFINTRLEQSATTGFATIDSLLDLVLVEVGSAENRIEGNVYQLYVPIGDGPMTRYDFVFKKINGIWALDNFIAIPPNN